MPLAARLIVMLQSAPVPAASELIIKPVLPLAPLSSGIPATAIIKGDDYSGEVRGIWASANGFARITEVV